jgi:FkbM family methyltransferase
MRAEDRSGNAHTIINGHRMYVDARDERGQALVRARAVLHPAAARLWGELIAGRHWDVVIDVGANYGEMLLSIDLPSDTTVLAVEPSQRVLPHLRRTLRESLPDVGILEAALSDQSGWAQFHDDETWWGNSTLCTEWVADRDHVWTTSTVRTVRVQELLDMADASPESAVVMKLDIEGNEGRVLADGLPQLQSLSDCRIMFEVVRLSPVELAWLLDNFHLSYFDLTSRTMMPCRGVSDPNDLQDLLSQDAVYARDLVAQPRLR